MISSFAMNSPDIGYAAEVVSWDTARGDDRTPGPSDRRLPRADELSFRRWALLKAFWSGSKSFGERRW